MKPRTLKILALVLVALSVVLAVAGYRLSQQQAPVQQAAGPAMEYQVVVAARNIEPGTEISEDDVQLIPYPVATTNTYSNLQQVLDKQNFSLIRSGEVLRGDHFAGASILANQVNPGHRAMAVTVDETIGTGGFLQPGDRVDVIYSSRASRETGNRSLARRVLTNIKVLAFGSEIPGAAVEEDKTGASKGKRSRTALLEVHQDDVGKLLLAETTGVLRLVALGEVESRALTEATAEATDAIKDKATTLPALTGWTGGEQPRPKVYVYHGDEVETVRTSP